MGSMTVVRLHVLGLLLALVSFVTSAPAVPKHRGPGFDLRTSSLFQIDDDEEREMQAALCEADDEDDDDSSREAEGRIG